MAIQMNIYDSLRQDHQSVQHVLDEMVKTSEADVSMRTQLFNRLKVEFLAHLRAEEKLLYPKLEQHRSSRELERTDVRDERWKAKASVLREMVRHHVEVEENAMFPKAHRLFSDVEAQQLASQFEDQKRIEQHHI